MDLSNDNIIKNVVIDGYRNILKREPDNESLQDYIVRIKSGLGIYEFYRMLVTLDEYRHRFGSENLIINVVTEGYRNILKREPDPGGLSAYTNHIKNGMSIEKFYEILGTSEEYRQMFGNQPFPKVNDFDIDQDYFDHNGYIKNIRNGTYKINGKNILVCITTYNGLKYLKRLVLSLKEQDCNHNLDILVVDNCSTDGTLEWSNRMKIKYESLERNRCSAAGLNRCLEKLIDNRHDYLVVLNNDILLEKSYIGTIVDDFEEQNRIRPGCLLMNGVQIGHMENKQIDALVREELQDFEDDILTGDYCAFIIKKEVIDKIGYFDERYTPRYIEDNDFTHRIYLSGGYCIRNGRCKFDHIMGATFRNKIDNANHVQTMVNNSMIYKDKWGAFQKGGERFHGMKQFIDKFPFDGGGSGKSSGRGNCNGIFDYKKE